MTCFSPATRDFAASDSPLSFGDIVSSHLTTCDLDFHTLPRPHQFYRGNISSTTYVLSWQCHVSSLDAFDADVDDGNM